MVKNRKTKAAARNLKQESGITYPRALDLIQGSSLSASFAFAADTCTTGFTVAGGIWDPDSHNSLWIEAGPIGRALFDRMAAEGAANDRLHVSVFDFDKQGGANQEYELSVDGPGSDALQAGEALQYLAARHPGSRRIIMIAGVPRLRTTSAGDQLLSRIVQMAPDRDCTFIMLGGLEPARGYWSRHYTTYDSGVPTENLAATVPGTGRADHSSLPLQHGRVLLGIGHAPYEPSLVEADFGARWSILVTGERVQRTAAAQSIAEATGATLWAGSLAELLDEVRGRAGVASLLGENCVSSTPEYSGHLVAVVDLDAAGGKGWTVITRIQREARRAGLLLVLTAAKPGTSHLGGPVTTVNVDGREAEIIPVGGRRMRLASFWHARPRRATPESMAVNAEANRLNTGNKRVWPRCQPVDRLEMLPGDTLRFHTGRSVYSVRGVSANFVVATGTSGGKPTYTVIDWANGQRGPHDSWGYGVVTDAEVDALLDGLERTRAREAGTLGPEDAVGLNPVQLSVRRSVYLDIKSVHRGRQKVWPQPVV